MGLTLRKDAFSEQNMKLREHVNMLKEKVVYQFWRKICEENASPSLNSNVANILDQLKLQVETD
jgi:hypothetical protein